MSERRIVFDTNAALSTLLSPNSFSRQAFKKARKEGKLLLSRSVIDELNDVFRRPKFDKYLPESQRLAFLLQILSQAVSVEITVTITACRDPKDNKFLELAVSGQADCIVSGDQDLLVLHPFQLIPILTPRQFLDHSWETDSP